MSLYYSPGEADLEIFETFDDPEAGYGFNMFVVWKHKDGRLFYATDSGCSCPSPFEYYNKIEDLTAITRAGFESFKSDFESWRNQYEENRMCDAATARELFDRVERELP